MLFTVTLPFAGYLLVGVEAANEAAAIDAALDLGIKLTPSGDGDPEVGEWSVLREITTGNVLHAPVNAAFADVEVA